MWRGRRGEEAVRAELWAFPVLQHFVQHAPMGSGSRPGGWKRQVCQGPNIKVLSLPHESKGLQDQGWWSLHSKTGPLERKLDLAKKDCPTDTSLCMNVSLQGRGTNSWRTAASNTRFKIQRPGNVRQSHQES
jgi:hypothetical protein